MAKAETDILNRWLLKWARWSILFRNQVGGAWAGHIVKKWSQDGESFVTLRGAYWMKFGLMNGSGDFIGWKTMTITQEMVGKKIAVFTSVEGKSKDGTLEPDQVTWLNNVRSAGGIAFVVRDENTPPVEWAG